MTPRSDRARSRSRQHSWRLLRGAAFGLLLACIASRASPAGQTPAAIVLPSLESFSPEVRALISEREAALSGVTGDQSAEAWGEFGKILQVHALLPQAEAAFLNALSLQPTNGKWAYYLALAAIESADLETAVERLRATVRLAPQYQPAGLRLATTLLELGRHDEAERALDSLIPTNETLAAIHYERAQIAAARGDDNLAIDEYRACLELQPTALRVHAQLASLYRGKGDQEASQRHAAAWGPGDINWPDPWLADMQRSRDPFSILLEQAKLASREDRLADSRKAYEQALEIGPDSFEAHSGYAALLDRQGDSATSIAAWREAIRLRPDDPLGYYNLGSLLARAGSFAEAEPAFRAALRNDPEDRESIMRLAYVLQQLGRASEVLAFYEPLLAAHPDDTELRMSYGSLLLRTGQSIEAARQFEQIVSQGRTTPAVYQAWATALAVDGEWSEARRTLGEGLGKHPIDVGLMHSMSRLKLRARDPRVFDPAGALLLALEAFRLQATAEHLETLAAAQAANGNYAEAVRAQTVLVAEAEERQDPVWIARARDTLERYQQSLTQDPPPGGPLQ